jgi:medium-chain acyl-[acyl-carrier-protein] hydrolase
MFCFPHAGVGASAFRGWADSLPDSIELFCLQPPGREHRFREAPFQTMSELVADATRAVAEWIDRPYVLCGHSMGALVAHETACKLRELGYEEPAHLFVSASRAPQVPWPHPSIHHLPDLEFLDQVNRRYGSVPAQVQADPELRALFVPALRGDFSIVETYLCPEMAPLTCPISAFRGEQDGTVASESVEAWRHRTQGRFRSRTVPGSHLFLQTSREQMQHAIVQDLETTLQAGRFNR